MLSYINKELNHIIKNKQSKRLFGYDYGVILITISYYLRSIQWIALTLIAYEVMNLYIPQSTVASLAQIILFVFLLCILIFLKLYYPDMYDDFRWFCTPGIIFLKSWTSLFFFAYLILLPSQIGYVAPEQIVSWVFQCVFGNIIALLLTAGTFTLGVYVFDFFNRPSKDDEKNDSIVVKEPSESFRNPSTDTVANDALSSMTKKPIEIRQSTVEYAYLEHIISRGSQYMTEDMAMEIAASDFLRKGTDIQSLTGSRLSVVGSFITSQRVRLSAVSSLKESIVVSPVSPGSEDFERPSTVLPFTEMSNNRLNFRISEMNTIIRPSVYTELVRTNPKEIPRDTISNVIPNFTGNNSLHTIEEDADVSVDRIAEDEFSVPLPYILDMYQILQVWSLILVTTTIINVLSLYKTKPIAIAFQMSACLIIFIGSTTYRMRIIGNLHWILQTCLQSPLLFTPPAVIIVILSSTQGFSDWLAACGQFFPTQTILHIAGYGAGNYLTVLLNPAIITLAFSAVEPILKYYNLLPIIFPLCFVSCILIYISTAVLSLILQSPMIIAYPLLARSITTPIALAVSEITGGNAGITAATAVFNGVLGYKLDAYILDYLKVSNPMTRGVTMGTAGSLLGVVSLDERKEELAAGIGMTGYAVATVCYAILIAIPPFEEFLLSIT